MTPDPRRCPFAGCAEAKHPAQFSCRVCWTKLPEAVRRRVTRIFAEFGGRLSADRLREELAAVVREHETEK